MKVVGKLVHFYALRARSLVRNRDLEPFSSNMATAVWLIVVFDNKDSAGPGVLGPRDRLPVARKLPLVEGNFDETAIPRRGRPDDKN
jgi:hypothetical protein